MLANFSIIVAVDKCNGIAKNKQIPWHYTQNLIEDASIKKDLKNLHDLTCGEGNNAIIMGSNTHRDIGKPLKGRVNIVLSKTLVRNSDDIKIYPSLFDALIYCKQTNFDSVFILGGEPLYKMALIRYGYLCKNIYLTRFNADFNCDQFFPALSNIPNIVMGNQVIHTDYSVTHYDCSIRHDEQSYLDLLRTILATGEKHEDRTDVGTIGIFGAKLTFDLQYLPILSTKRVAYDVIIKELLFFISGKTDTKILEAQGVNIWRGNTSMEYLKKYNLPLEPGDYGALYGYQWRYWNGGYPGNEGGIDQIKELITSLTLDKQGKHNRRHVLSAWNVSQLNKMVLPPCHMFAQFNVSNDKKYLDCQVYLRSNDMFLGAPFNITSYALLTYMLGHVVGLSPRTLHYAIGDAHIYNNHIDVVKEQLTRSPYPFPILKFARNISDIDDFKLSDFIIEDYHSWPALKAAMAI